MSSGKDHSANFVLGPAILDEVSRVQELIDIGCGTGWLTERAAKLVDSVVGIDPSEESIAIARQRHCGPRIVYCAESIEGYAREQRKFDLAISNMSASSTPNLQSFMLASRSVLKKNSLFVFSIPHPCFWPLYWGYASHERFNYQESCAVEGEFRIQNESSKNLTTHFHHPLESYIAALANSQFSIEEMRELVGRGFRLPRFMLIKARAI